MSRMSASQLNSFRLIGSESECYFCGDPKKIFDTTPHRSVMDKAPASMERIRVAACISCGQRIHYANMILEHSGKREGAERGLMTFEAKERLCKAVKWAKPGDGQKPEFVLNSGILVPGSTTVDGERIYVDGLPWTLEELRAIQGPMAMKLIGLDLGLVADCFWALVVADDATKVIDVDKCKTILGL